MGPSVKIFLAAALALAGAWAFASWNADEPAEREVDGTMRDRWGGDRIAFPDRHSWEQHNAPPGDAGSSHRDGVESELPAVLREQSDGAAEPAGFPLRRRRSTANSGARSTESMARASRADDAVREDRPSRQAKIDLLNEDEGVFLGEDARMSIPLAGKLDGPSGTIDMLIEPSWDGSERRSNHILTVGESTRWNNFLRIAKHIDQLRFTLRDDTGATREISVSVLDWVAGERHQITASWGDSKVSLYIDGRLVGESSYPGVFRPGERATIQVGAHANPKLGGGVNANIYDLGLYSEALSPGEL